MNVAKGSDRSCGNRGWYENSEDPRVELFWDGSQWTGQAWHPDPYDPEQRIYWDRSRWTGDRRRAEVPPFTPYPPTDWTNVAGVVLGALAGVSTMVGRHNARRNARRASFARDWDLGSTQFGAQRRQRHNDYVGLWNQWPLDNRYNPYPPPPPLPRTN